MLCTKQSMVIIGDQLPTKVPFSWRFPLIPQEISSQKSVSKLLVQRSTSEWLIFVTTWNSLLVVESPIAKIRKEGKYQWAQNHQCVVHVWGCHSEDPAAHVLAHMKEVLEESATSSCPALLSPLLQIRQCLLFTSAIYSWCACTHWIIQFKPTHQMYIPPEVLCSYTKRDHTRWRNTGIYNRSVHILVKKRKLKGKMKEKVR